MKVNIGDICRVKPSKALVKVFDIQKSLANILWLKGYWKTKYNIKLPSLFDIVEVKFLTSNKGYLYPRYRKCIKRLRRQKKYRKIFAKPKYPTKGASFLTVLKRDYNKFLEDMNNESLD